jgi:DNA-binding transcriptional ArsR family regulator
MQIFCISLLLYIQLLRDYKISDPNILTALMPETLRRFKAEFFKALAHPMRIQILETLREGERNVTELQELLAAEGSSVSQQLAVLRNKNIVDTRKVGTSVYYTVRDPALFDLLDVARTIFNNHLIDTRSILEQLEEEA